MKRHPATFKARYSYMNCESFHQLNVNVEKLLPTKDHSFPLPLISTLHCRLQYFTWYRFNPLKHFSLSLRVIYAFIFILPIFSSLEPFANLSNESIWFVIGKHRNRLTFAHASWPFLPLTISYFLVKWLHFHHLHHPTTLAVVDISLKHE